MRNNFVFRNQQPDPYLAIESALAQIRLFYSLDMTRSRTGQDTLNPEQLWRPPDLGTLKCNIGGAYQPGSAERSIACICRDHRGRLTAFEAEIQALTFTLQHLLWQELNDANLVIDSDYLALVELCETGDRRRGSFIL